MKRLDDTRDARVRAEYRRPLLVVTLPGAVAIVLGFAIVAGLASWNYGRLRDQAVTAVARNGDRDVARGQKADFDLCQAVGSNAHTLKAVIDTSYMTSNPDIDVSTLPPESQKLLVDLLPILGLYARSGQANHDKVAAQVKDPPTCIAPKGSTSRPVVSTAPTSTTTSTTTTTVATFP